MSVSRSIRARAALARIVRRAQARGRRVVFTNGCFDLLHAGHVRLLEQARRCGDLLVVGINSDRSVRALKGAGRPVVPQRDRALVVGALKSVDYVTIFDEATPQRLIARLKPDILVKGGDWRREQIVGRDIVEGRGGRVVRIPLLQGRSSSAVVERILRAHI